MKDEEDTEKKTQRHGDGATRDVWRNQFGSRVQHRLPVPNPRVSVSPRLRVFFFILHPSAFIFAIGEEMSR